MKVNEVISSVENFFRACGSQGTPFCNEAELQHELGYWLRANLRGETSIYFERPAKSFIQQANGLVKKEIDLVAAPRDARWHFAIELKCPRSGRIPETMFDACRDLQFLEQLVSLGFRGGLFVMHVDDALFYEAVRKPGIYSFFRAGVPLTGTILKPTGRKDQYVLLTGSYVVDWQPCGTSGRYWLQIVKPRTNRAGW